MDTPMADLPPRSRLLSLPFELRQMIWEYAFGHQIIHLPFSKDEFGPTTHLAPETCAHDSAQTSYTTWQTSAPVAPRCDYLLSCGYIGAHQTASGKHTLLSPQSRRLALDLLLVSRQIHAEAAHIPFSTNVFSITDGFEFTSLLSSKRVLQSQLSSIQCLSIGLFRYKDGPMYWGDGDLGKHVFKYLQGLRMVHVVVGLSSCADATLRAMRRAMEALREVQARDDGEEMRRRRVRVVWEVRYQDAYLSFDPLEDWGSCELEELSVLEKECSEMGWGRRV